MFNGFLCYILAITNVIVLLLCYSPFLFSVCIQLKLYYVHQQHLVFHEGWNTGRGMGKITEKDKKWKISCSTMRRIYTHSNEFRLQKMRHFEEILFLTCVCVCARTFGWWVFVGAAYFPYSWDFSFDWCSMLVGWAT